MDSCLDPGPKTTRGPASDLLASSWLPSKWPKSTLMSALSLTGASAMASGSPIPPETVLSVLSATGSQTWLITALPRPGLIPEVGMLACGARSVCFLKVSLPGKFRPSLSLNRSVSSCRKGLKMVICTHSSLDSLNRLSLILMIHGLRAVG